MKLALSAAMVLALVAIGPTSAQPARAGALTVRDVQLRASLGGSPNTAGYLRVDNATPADDRLVGASCACARSVELHRSVETGGVARMERVAGYVVASVDGLTLRPGGGHLMLIGLRRPLRDGERVPLTLRFQRAGTVVVNAAVTGRPGAAAEHHAHH